MQNELIVCKNERSLLHSRPYAFIRKIGTASTCDRDVLVRSYSRWLIHLYAFLVANVPAYHSHATGYLLRMLGCRVAHRGAMHAEPTGVAQTGFRAAYNKT